MRRLLSAFVLSLGVALPITDLIGASKSGAQARPNIIVILSDDMGYSDIGANGGEIRTPALDRLAAQGRQFTQFYSTARCCPSRASLLTGLYSHQAGVGHLVYKTPHPGYGDFLAQDSITIAEALRESGYGTYMVGKWHLAPRSFDAQKDAAYWPTGRGFDKFYGTIAGSGSFWDPATLCRDETFITPENDPEYRPENFYYTDAITDNALTFIQRHEQDSAEKAFFLYMAYTAAHWPLHAPAEAIRSYAGKYDEGYAVIHQRRVARLRELGLIPEVSDTAEPVGTWAAVADKAVEASLMETYAAMVTRMDEGIGRVVEFLRASGQLENTLILYMQDNGACAEDWFSGENAADQKYQPMGRDQLQALARPVQTRDGRAVRTGYAVEAGPADTFTAYKENWANVSNAPFRKYKHYMHEGGISSPLIMHWPQRIQPDISHRLVREPAHLIDIMATCLDAAGVKPPTERKGIKVQPQEGVSLIPVSTGTGSIDRREPLFWEHESNRAVRDGKWKIVSLERDPWELYDMTHDRGEMHDLAANHPEIVERLSVQWDRWAERARVLPLGGWMDRGDQAVTLELKQGDVLSVKESPLLAGRAVNLGASVAQGPVSGVIVAQGSQRDGFVLYARDGALSLVVRRNGKVHTLTMPAIPPTPFKIQATIGPKGRATLSLDDRRVEGSLGKGFLVDPSEGVSVGFDAETPVGEYPGKFPFEGKLGFVRVRTDLQKKTSTD